MKAQPLIMEGMVLTSLLGVSLFIYTLSCDACVLLMNL